jgi:hypothetical protein
MKTIEYRTIKLSSKTGDESGPWTIDDWQLEADNLNMAKSVVDSMVRSMERFDEEDH